jgi:hypothetical protein
VAVLLGSKLPARGKRETTAEAPTPAPEPEHACGCGCSDQPLHQLMKK